MAGMQRQRKAVPPQERQQTDQEKVVSLARRRLVDRRESPAYMIELRKKIVTRTMREMNRKHAYLEDKNDVAIVTLDFDFDGKPELKIRKKAHLAELLACRQVILPKVSKGGKISFEEKNPVEIWCNDRRRRNFKGLVNKPGVLDNTRGNDQYINLWEGWGTSPSKIPLIEDGEPVLDRDGHPRSIPDYSGAGCQRILQHIREVWTPNDDPAFKWVVAWLANIVQKPLDKPGTGVMVYGGQGAGKSIIIEKVMSRILGRAYGLERDTKFLTADFNSTIAGKLLIFADEALFAGDLAAAQRLKTFITSESINIRELYKNGKPVENHARLFAAANAAMVMGHVLPMEKDDRRWTVLKVSTHRVADRKYFDALLDEIETGGVEAFHAYLLNPALLDGIDLSLPLETEAGLEQKMSSLPPVEHFIYECLRERSPVIHLIASVRTEWTEGGATIGQADWYDGFLNWGKRINDRYPATARHFNQKVRELLPTVTEGRSGSAPRHWNLPPLSAARGQFQKWIKCADHFDAMAVLWNDGQAGTPKQPETVDDIADTFGPRDPIDDIPH